MSQLVGPVDPRTLARTPENWKKLRKVGGYMDEYAKTYRSPESDGLFVAYVSADSGGEGLHFISVDGRTVAYRSYGGEGRKMFNQLLTREFNRYFGARNNPLLPFRMNPSPRLRRNSGVEKYTLYDLAKDLRSQSEQAKKDILERLLKKFADLLPASFQSAFPKWTMKAEVSYRPPERFGMGVTYDNGTISVRVTLTREEDSEMWVSFPEELNAINAWLYSHDLHSMGFDTGTTWPDEMPLVTQHSQNI